MRGQGTRGDVQPIPIPGTRYAVEMPAEWSRETASLIVSMHRFQAWATALGLAACDQARDQRPTREQAAERIESFVRWFGDHVDEVPQAVEMRTIYRAIGDLDHVDWSIVAQDVLSRLTVLRAR